jgi:HEAT repeat protein
MPRSRARAAGALLALLLAAHPAAGAGDGAAAALAEGVRSEDPIRRREALERVCLDARSLAADDAERLRGVLGRRLGAERVPDLRALVVRAFGRLGGESALEPLLAALGSEEEPAPQAALVDAFADLPAAAAARALSKAAFGDGDPRARALAAEALGRVPGESALRALLALSETTHPWPVQAAVLLGLSLRQDPAAVDAVLAGLRATDPAVRAAAREGAERLLGEDLGPDAAPWEERWKRDRAGWVPPATRPAEARVAGPTAGERPEGRTTARFYDIPVSGGRVAFVLDCSQSMWGEKAETSRAELEAAVKGLRSSQRFGVVLFHEKVWTWRPDLVPAAPAQKWAFARTLPGLPTKSYTNIHDSLERAFAWAGEGRRAVEDPPGLDEVFFLSDGEPNRGRLRDPDRIAAAVKEWAAASRVRVHCVALGERPAAGLLEAIARESGGRFVRK